MKTQGLQVYYRGYLKSCNYACSYCPFSKKKMSERQLMKDREALFRFIDRIGKLEETKGERFAVQIVPYGEALIHDFYWEAMAKLSCLSCCDAVGCQTNLSFPVEKMISKFSENQGNVEKLRLWCTYHPAMTGKEDFLKQSQSLRDRGVKHCIGAVGNPENIQDIKALRRELPPEIYFWINRMDGLKRQYTSQEKKALEEIDPFFHSELSYPAAACENCKNSWFVQADGRVTPCNLSKSSLGNLYDNEFGSSCKTPGSMSGACKCFLAYCNRLDREENMWFYPYPAFRILNYPAAICLDTDQTIVGKGGEGGFIGNG